MKAEFPNEMFYQFPRDVLFTSIIPQNNKFRPCRNVSTELQVQTELNHQLD